MPRNRVGGQPWRAPRYGHMMTMTQTNRLTARFPTFAPLPTAAADYDIVRRAIAHIRGNWRSQPEIDTIAMPPASRHRPASSVPPLVRADAEGLPAGAHAQPRARLAARLGERARHRLRGRPVRPGPAARSVRHARGDVAGRMEGGRRRSHHHLRLPSLPVRHGAGDDDAARARRPRARRRRQGARRAARHARALAARRNTSRISPPPRRPRAASSTPRCGARTSRCAWC